MPWKWHQMLVYANIIDFTVSMFCPAGLALLLEKVPSAVFQGSVPGVRSYTFLNRAACLGVKFLEYSLAGMFCGFLGQGIANGMMLAKNATQHLSCGSDIDCIIKGSCMIALPSACEA